MSTPHAPDPTNYPHVTIDGKQYQVRLDIGDVIALQKQGVDLLRTVALDMPGPDGLHPSILERSLKILAQGIHADPPIPWDKLADKIGFAGMNEAIRKTTEAVKKVAAQIGGESAPAEPQPLIQ
jgi:hypothetical protein